MSGDAGRADREPARAVIDEFVARSRELSGRDVVERAPWHTCATEDAIRHFAYGTSDDNPLWLDREHARATPHGSLLAPPAFVCSVLYPFLHGAPIAVPLASLISGMAMEWQRPIREGDRLRASARQLGVTDTFDRRGRRLILIDAETRYWNQDDELVAVAHGTMARIARDEGDLFLDRRIHQYPEEEQLAIRQALEEEARRGRRSRTGHEVWVGQPLPVLVRGPLAVGDLVCWQAAIGPSYRAGALGYRDLLDAPHHAAINPATGWPVKYSQQHEDFLMAAQRGMPAPFDNSLMRFAWIAPMLTDWIGDEGVLARLAIHTDAPLLYGDTTWYRGIVTGKRPATSGDGTVVTIRIAGVNQLGQATTSGEADVILPARRRSVGVVGGRAGASREPGVLDLLRAQADSRPDAVAVECGATQLTYAELDRRVRLGAQALVRRGAEPGAPAALALDRSVDAVVAILAALEAGCPYVPIDPRADDKNLRRALAGAAPGLVLDAGSYAGLGAGETAGAIAPADVPDDTFAYFMPTSGTASTSRLVAVSHASLGRYLRSLPAALGTQPDDVFVHTAAFTFSASVRQLFLPLTTGARLVVASDEERLDPFALWQLITARRVTVWDTVPSIWGTCLEAFGALSENRRAELLSGDLRLILTTGERLPWSLPRRWRDQIGHRARCVNLYSQTETAGTVCVHHVPAQPREAADGDVPLGKPLPHVRVEIVDERLQPVADGDAGELCVGGGQLASGYVGNSDLTSERFVLRPFRHDGFYRTGDLARRRSDGTLEFLGRRDDRVKIRGQRVDLKDVEDALRSMPGIADACVAVHEREGALPRLVAWIVAADGEPMAAGELLARLRPLVAPAALPAAFVPLDRLPRNAAGKVDRHLLPDPAGRLPLDEPDATPAGSGLADRVGRIFAEALALRRVGHDDDFFDLGGNSLLASVLIGRLRAAFGVPIPLARFFERPTVRAVASVVEEQIVERVGALSEDDAANAGRRIPRAPRDGRVAASFSQERMWLFQQMYPEAVAYNSQVAVHFTGPLDVVALERSLDEIVRRHEICRTSLHELDGVLVQRVREGARAAVRHVDLTTVPVPDVEARARQVIDEEIRRPFRLDDLPLVRWTLMHLGPDRHILICMDHHAVTDGWSRHIVLRELMAIYGALVSGRAPDLPAPRLQFADFAVWQREWLAGAEGRAQIRYWTERLARSRELIDLPYDRPHPAEPSFRGGHLMMRVGEEELRPLRGVATAAEATMFMTVLAVFVALLRRYGNGDDLCVGTGIANRRLPDADALVGMLINTVVLRVDLAGDPTFRTLLDRVRLVTLDAYANQEAPFEKVVEAVSPARRTGINPLHQVTFNFQNNPMPAMAFAGVEARLERPLFNGSAKYDLYVAGWPRSPERHGDWQRDDSDVLLSWEFNTDVFDEATISRMQAQFRQLLVEAGRHPDRPVSELRMDDDEERAYVEAWAGPTVTAGDTPPVHALVEEHAARTPDTVAVVAGHARLTYAELNDRADHVAAALRRFGVGRDERVAVYLGRSLDTIVSLLGILKAGGAYVPIDPGYPPARRDALVAACCPRCLVTSRALRSGLRDGGEPVVVVEDVRAPVPRPAEPGAAADGESLAYVLFTSGSTGEPRAVAVPHRAVVRLVRGADFARLDDSQTWLHISPLSFDASTLDIWAPLANGGRLVLMPDGTPSLDDIERVIRTHGVTSAFFTAGLFDLIARERIDALSGMQQVIAGGDVVPVEAVRRVASRFPGLRVINGYGPTENTTFTACHTVRPGDLTRRRLPIGRPIAGTTVHVLDARGEPCPIGVAGELCAGGLGLARGYWNDPEATAERFFVHPRYGRLYRTGDVCRLLPDGSLEFIGRRDRQVKVRGHRIEPAEIERALQACPGVSSAVVGLRGESAADKTLAAYVVADRSQPAPAIGDLRAALRQVLPDYAQPSAIHVLDRLPLTPNGKIDRAALAALPATPGRPHPLPPRTPMEEVVAAVWQDVLAHDGLGIHDDFFQVGGHSLAALRVLSLIKARTGVRLQTMDFFRQPTIAGLAARADRLSLDSAYGVPGTDGFLVELRGHGAGAPLFILPGGWGEANQILVFAALLRHFAADRPTYGVRSRAMDRSRPVPEQVDEQSRDVLRAVALASRDRPFAIVGECAASTLAMTLAAQAEAEGRRVEAVVLLDPGPLSHVLSLDDRVAAHTTAAPMADVRSMVARASKAVGVFGPLSALRSAVRRRSSPGDAASPPRPRGLPRRVEEYFRMLATWNPQPVRSPIHVVLSTRWSDTAAVAESWKPLALGPLAVHQVSGDHHSYIRDQAADTARVLVEILR